MRCSDSNGAHDGEQSQQFDFQSWLYFFEIYSSEKSEKLFLQGGAVLAQLHMIVRSVSSMNSRDGNYIQGLEFYSSEKSEKLFSQ